MFTNTELLKKVSDIAERDGRYKKESFLFILAALENTIAKLPKRRHLSGQELSSGIVEYAREQYGYMGKLVLNNWGITITGDFGEIVYLMINENLLTRTDEDSKDDFYGVFDLDSEFEWDKIKPMGFQGF